MYVYGNFKFQLVKDESVSIQNLKKWIKSFLNDHSRMELHDVGGNKLIEQTLILVKKLIMLRYYSPLQVRSDLVPRLTQLLERKEHSTGWYKHTLIIIIAIT